MSRDDRIDDLPSPDDPVSPAEHAQAESFARLVDELLAGRPLPPTMTADERALTEVAGMVRASMRPLELAPARQRVLIQGVLQQALAAAEQPTGGSSTAATGAGAGQPSGGRTGGGGREPARHTDVVGVDDLAVHRKSKLARYVPWTVAGMAAAAAVVVLWLGRPGLRGAELAIGDSAPARDVRHLSRPADPLIGEIPHERADRAGERLDIIFADRMAGYRDLRLRGGQR